MSQTLPPLRAVRVFASAARHLSFRLAAEELHLTASAVSHQIRALEDFLGVSLFDRTGRRISLTAAGQRYRRGVDLALAQLDASTREILNKGRTGPLRISAAPIFVSRWLMPRLHEFYADHPELELSICPAIRPVNPHSPDVDLLIRYTDTAVKDPDIVEEKLMDATLSPVCTPALAAQWQRDQTLPAHVGLLEDEAFPGHRWHNWFAAYPDCPLASRQITGFDTLTHLLTPALEGYGVALQMLEMLDDLFERGQLVRLYPSDSIPAGRTFRLIYRRNSERRADIRTLTGWIRQRLTTGDGAGAAPLTAKDTEKQA
ncbi:LysR substrate-binding domain-containing protein [Granulosicoccaceae sp. 1_MG-2023]|nr:LysR substrate-binding domain-containing protein [Granulosicoccaceae sp. 1_MG-2023]